MVLEDLHWSDISTLDWLRSMARRRESAKLLILGTYRPADVLANNHPLRAVVQDLQARQQCEEIHLTPLGEEAITAYLAKRFGELHEPHALVATLAHRTGGNSLFLVNTVDYLVEQEIVTEEAGRWTIRADKVKEVSEGIPDTLRQLIERQVERLSEEDKRALEVASVVGIEFAVVEAEVGLQGDVEALEFQYEHLVRTGQFLRAEGITEWPDGTLSGRYSFLHAMYHEVVAARVGEARRMQLHRRIAERKEAAYGERTREVAAELAVHFEQGREYAKAVQYRGQAGEAAARAGAPQEALSHLKRGLELLTLLPDSPERLQHEVRLQLALTNPLYAIGGRTALDEMERAYLRAHELCQRLGEPPQLASVLFGLCMACELRGEVQKGLNLAEHLLTLAQKGRNPALFLRAHMALGNVLYFLGEFPASRRHLEQGLAVYAPDKHSPRVSNVAQDLGVVCFSRAAWVLWCLGYPEQARRSGDRGLALAHELSHFLSEAFALDGAIGVARECGELPTVERHVARLIALSQEQGFSYPHAWGRIVQGWLLGGQGKVEEGIAHLRRGLSTVRLGGQELGLPYFMGLLAEAYGTAGRIDEGLAVVAEALTIGQRCGERFYDAELYRLRGELLLTQEIKNQKSEIKNQKSENPNSQFQILDPAAEAEACFHQALEVARQQQAKSFELRAATSLARLWRTQGKDAEARRLLEEIYGWFTEGFDTKDLQEAEALLLALGGNVKTEEERQKAQQARGLRLKAEGPPPFSPSSLQPVASSLAQHSALSTQSLSSPAPSTQHLTPSVVGREAELGYLQDRWSKALEGARQIVFLSGEAGIGKTTLTDAFVSQLHERPDMWIAHGQCVEQYGAGEAYLPILEALGRLGREPGKADVATVLAQYAPTWLAQLPALVPPADRDALQRVLAGATRVRMLRELAEALEVLSAHHVLVLVLEDLHWSDPSTVELLAYLLRRQGAARLFIIGTYRPAEILTTDHPLKRAVQELQGRGHCEVLQLELLPEAAVAAYLRGRFGEVPTELSRMLHQRTEGNPLFMVATVEHLMREGIVVAEGQRWRITQEISALPIGVPENLRQLIEKQLEGLSPEEQRVLEVASVAGADFVVATLAPELQRPLETLEEHCASFATRRQFIRAAGVEHSPDGAGSGRYGFVHALYQRVIYERIAEARRVQLHCRIGECKEQRYGERAAEIASELAIHFEAGGDVPRAVRYLALAGETAVRRQAHQEAIHHLTKGIELLRTLPETSERRQQELTLHLGLGIPLIATQGWAAPQVGQVYGRAYELCQQIGETPLLFPVLRGLQVFHMNRTEYATARQLAEQLLRLAQQLQDPALLVGTHLAMGQTLFFSGEFTQAWTHLEQGLALNPQQHNYQSWPGGHPGISCLGYGAWTLWFLGYPDQALRMSQEALTLARDWANPFPLAFALQFVAKVHHARREARATQERTEENIALSTTQGFTAFVALETGMRGWAIAEQGQREEGVAQMTHILSAWRTAGMDFGRPFFLAALADIYGNMEQPEDGLHALTEALALVEGNGERQSEAELYRLKGQLTLQKGARDWGLGAGEKRSPASKVQGEEESQNAKVNTQQSKVSAAQSLALSPQSLSSPDPRPLAPDPQAEAEAYFYKALEVARQQQAKSLELRAAMSLARLWRTQGKDAEARQLLEEVYAWFTEGFDTKDLQDAEALLRVLGSAVVKTEEEKKKARDERARGERQEAEEGKKPTQEEGSPPFSLSILQPVSSSPAQPSVPSPQSLSSPTPSPQSPPPNSFRSEGEYWTLVFQGTVARIKDTRGMHHLAYLLQHPDQEFSALALAADTPDFSTSALTGMSLLNETRDPATANVHIVGFTDAGEVLDPQAKAAYRQRLTELRDELEEAQEFNDVGRIEKLQDELEFVTQELMGAVGLRGRARKSASPQERARVNVTRAMRTAIARVAEAHPALGRHLTQTIKTGTFCSYVPEPLMLLTWEF